MGRPDATSAQVTALGPGMTSTGSPSSRAASTRRWPGSDTPGMPASDTKATRWPAATRAITDSTRRAITFSSQRSSGTRMPKRASSLPVTRVSSQSSTSAERSVSSTRGDASERLPMGVPTSESMPPVERGRACSPAADARSLSTAEAQEAPISRSPISRTCPARSWRAPRARPSSRAWPRSSTSGRTTRRCRRRSRAGRP